MRKLLGLLILPGLLLVGCAPDWNPRERDLINQVKITDSTYYASLTEEQLMDRFYGACHMLQGGMPMADVFKQVPKNRNAGSWANDIGLAITFLCPEQRGK
jgi:hypothetical protein